MERLKVCWISAGVSSFVAGYLARDSVDKYIYIDIEDQHPDSLRFIHDCEAVLGHEIEILRSTEYKNVEETVLAFGTFRNSVNMFAPCTNWLKKRVRKLWESENKGENIIYVWGMDCTEKERALRLSETMQDYGHCFPLIEKGMTKEKAHGLCSNLVKRPVMYEMGYNNNNCVGCIKGGMGYWNKIREDFPCVFEKRAALERKVGTSILKEKDGTPLFLDELDPSRGRKSKIIVEDCDLFCMMEGVTL